MMPLRPQRNCSSSENPAQALPPDTVGSARAQGWFSMLRTLSNLKSGMRILQGETLPVLARPRQEAWRHWARALAYANTGKAAGAREEAAKFDASLADYRAKTHRANPEELEVARLEMQAHLEFADGRADRALKQFAQASKAERRLTYTEPPYYPRPVAEPWATRRFARTSNRKPIAHSPSRWRNIPTTPTRRSGLRAKRPPPASDDARAGS